MSINDPTQFPQGPTVAQQFAQGLSSIPQSHGVDLSGYQPVNPFQYQAAGLAKTPSSALPPSLPSSQPHGIGGFFSNLWNNGIKPVYNDLSAGLQGWNTNGFQGMVQGFAHPAIGHQQYAQHLQNIDSTISNPFQRWATNTLYDTTSNPLTYVPVAGVARVAGITPALKFGADLLKGTVRTADAGKTTADTAANVASQALKKTGGFASPLTDAQAQALNDWAGISGGYVKPDVPAWEYNYTNPMDVLNDVHPTTADKIAPLIQGLNKDQAIPELLGGGALKGNLDQLRSLGSNAVQAYADMAGAKPLMGATAKGATFDAVKQSFSDVANRLAQLSHTAEPITPQETGFVLRGGPLMVIPQAAKDATDAAASQVPSGIGPYANYAWQSKLGAPIAQALQKAMPNGSNTVKAITNLANSAFKPFGGARDYFTGAVSRFYGARQSGANRIQNQLTNIFKGVPLETRQALIHTLESTAPGTKLADPTLDVLRQKVEPLLEQAHQQALSKGLIDHTLDLNQMGVGRYLPHIRTDKLDVNGNPVTNGRILSSSVDASKTRDIPGTIAQINANPDLPNFENDALKVLGYHLHQLNSATAAKDLINEALGHGVPVPEGYTPLQGESVPGSTQQAAIYAHDGQHVLLPESEANFLTQMTGNSQSNLAKKALGAYRVGVNTANKVMFAGNPFIHVMNNLGWQTLVHNPKIFADMPQYMKEAFTGVQPGSKMDEALQAGALHLSSEVGKRGSTREFVNDLTKSVDKNSKLDIAKQPFKQYYNFTPNFEKAYRAAAYHDAIKRGLTPDEASQFVRNIYGGSIGPNTMSPVDRGLSSLMPFWNWTKTAIGSNVKNATENPAPYVATFNAMNDLNQQNTGHPIRDNKSPVSIGLPEQNAQGNQEFWTPYFPALDVAKLGEKMATEGPMHGALDFAFSRTNPIVKDAANLATGIQNPFAPTNDQYTVNPYPYLPAQFNTRGMFFGDKGPQLPAMEAQFAQNMSNPLGSIYEGQGEGPTAQRLTNPFLPSLGGSISAPNPNSAAKEQKYAASQMKSELKSWTKQHAGK